jgi:hypothetical protein
MTSPASAKGLMEVLKESPAPVSALRVARVNPLDYEAELKALMTANGIPWFADFFDRGYRSLHAEGGASWVGFDDVGRLQMSLTQFVHAFEFGDKRLLASATGNVMVAEPYRTFFPAFSLFKRMLSDTRAGGEIDFVYGDPVPGASAVCRAAKMEQIGNLDRLVLPIADATLAKHVGARLLARAPLILGGRTAPDVRCYPAANYSDLDELSPAAGADDRLVPRHPISMLRRRLHGFPGLNDFVVELRWNPAASRWDALVLLRLAPDTRILSILSIRQRSDISLRCVIPALPPLARRLGAHRLQVETLLESRMAAEFRSLGFRPRGDTLPVVAKAFSAAGEDAVRNAAQWEITAIDMER